MLKWVNWEEITMGDSVLFYLTWAKSWPLAEKSQFQYCYSKQNKYLKVAIFLFNSKMLIQEHGQKFEIFKKKLIFDLYFAFKINVSYLR